MNIYLRSTQFLLRKDAVTYVLVLPSERVPGAMDTNIITSTEADIRATMAVPAENWGNVDMLADCQNKVATLYPDRGYTVVPEPEDPEPTP